jgi:hypothetical protein
MSNPDLLPPSALSSTERHARSRLAQLVHDRCWLRGCLAPRRRTCGKANCRCARGQWHVSLYLVQSRQGKLRQLSVPRRWQEHVRQAVSHYQQIQRLLEEISEGEWQRLRPGRRR